ncbi:hypothetical protein AWC11_27310 [Mycobacterium interjectum]|uniref:Uncharacterized protein n=1 Tax=Mycobacterium terramassiliense TaxID=1841859 RepID=A0A2U3NEM6_9MYCO|nr:hypothetical protein [Mycobacterium terramassiliense]ORV81057.1 hypothetical protein AWC11_27310 [Mycobacterium interjectum]SPM29952.1 hypothetical protein MTAB308_3450 [Mycobacterium terramassiliense]
MNATTVTIGTTPTLICAISYGTCGAIVQNSGDVPVFLGNQSVAPDNSLSLAPGQVITIPGGTDRGFTLYGVAATDTGAVTFLDL